MKEFLFCLLFGLACVTYFVGLGYGRKITRKSVIDKLYFLSTLFGAGWGLFGGLVLMQTDEDMAALFRAVGMLHIFGLLICFTHMMIFWSNVQGRMKRWTAGFVWLGVPLYPFVIRRENVAFEMTTYGMSYRIRPGAASTAYAVFCAAVAVNLFCLSVYMVRRCVRKREKDIAYSLMMCVVIVGFGCALDTTLQLLGFAAFPASTLGQFVAQMVLCKTYLFYNGSRVTLENMSKFVYYSVDEPVFLFDETGRLCIVNNGATIFLGLSAEECCKLRLEDIFVLKRDAFKFRGNKNRVEARCWQRNNICSISIDKIYDDYQDIIGYIVIVHDVTERVRMLERLEREKQRADRANEAKSAFLANMSHEIRTPINAVMGMNEMILRESAEPDTLEYARNIQNASKTLLVIINDILDFSKIESGMMELVEKPYALGTLLQDLQTECSVRAEEKGLALRFVVPEDTPGALIGDEVRVRQVLLNILTNAVKYTMKGSVTMTVSYERQPQDMVKLSFAVEDTGIGIKPENIGRLFGKFDRINEEQVHAIEGTGLGLSIVDRLVSLMNGSVTVESEYGHGSVFTVVLRQKIAGDETVGAMQDQPKRHEGKAASGPLFVAPHARILAVDDNKVNLAVIRGLLRKTKAQVTCVTSGRECLEAAAGERYDVILLDHMMPVMDGIETLEEFGRMPDNKSGDARVIALTANAMAGVREMYLEKGFDDYLSKPIEGAALEKLLVKYLPPELVQLQPGAE